LASRAEKVLWADVCADPVLSVEDWLAAETWALLPLESGAVTDAEVESLDASANPVACCTGTVAVLFVTAEAASWTWPLYEDEDAAVAV
jgi:hypothetical protein